MHRVASILLIAVFLALGSGALERLHNLDHAAADALALASGTPNSQQDSVPLRHDDSNCAIHAQLHLPLIATQWIPLLVLLGLFVAFLTELPRSVESHRFLLLPDCRGPPACCLTNPI